MNKRHMVFLLALMSITVLRAFDADSDDEWGPSLPAEVLQEKAKQPGYFKGRYSVIQCLGKQEYCEKISW
jgi:hypothetical protein